MTLGRFETRDLERQFEALERLDRALWLPALCPKVVGREIRMPEGFRTLVEEAKVSRENVLRG